MARIRRIVTGHNSKGQSIVASDEQIDGTVVPGMESVALNTIWGCDEIQQYPDSGPSPEYATFFPPIGGARIMEFTLAAAGTAGSDSEVSADVAAQTENLFPGLLAHFDAADPGMHRSATTDMLYVLEGRCVLELGDGSSTELKRGDTVIQSGTMHRWQNPYDQPCRLLGFVVGAKLDF